MSEIDVSKCRFQSECIEYKDISVNHIINILEPCPCFKMSMAINKENECKYFTIYKQLQQLKQENEELRVINKANADSFIKHQEKWKQENEELKKYKNLCSKMREFHFNEKKINLSKIIEENKVLSKDNKEHIQNYAELEAENNHLRGRLKEIECNEKFPNECHCAFRCLGNEWCDEAENRFKKAEQKLKKIKEICKNCAKYSFLMKREEILFHDILQIIEE